jgi:predicted nucleotidyltransferase component of viral defense system
MSEKLLKQYYKDLYSLQNSVFELVEPSGFYLTGGTALSRFYTQHRYSDDLDFFIHKNDLFIDDVKKIISALKNQFKIEIQVMAEDFTQLFIHNEDLISKYHQDFQAKLKVEFVKEAIEELLVFDLIKTFPLNMFGKIRWTNPANIDQFLKDREIILADFVSKGPNSLAP